MGLFGKCVEAVCQPYHAIVNKPPPLRKTRFSATIFFRFRFRYGFIFFKFWELWFYFFQILSSGVYFFQISRPEKLLKFEPNFLVSPLRNRILDAKNPNFFSPAAGQISGVGFYFFQKFPLWFYFFQISIGKWFSATIFFRFLLKNAPYGYQEGGFIHNSIVPVEEI